VQIADFDQDGDVDGDDFGVLQDVTAARAIHLIRTVRFEHNHGVSVKEP